MWRRHAELKTKVRRESSNTSLEDIKGILDSIQDTIARILHENGQLRNELKELKASLKSKDHEVQSLQESLSKTCEQNKALELELNAAKVKINKQEDEIYNLLDNLDRLEQYTRKKSGNPWCPKRSIQLYRRGSPRNRQCARC